MTEAGRAVIEFAFDRVGLHRIELHADTRTAASIRVAKKLGFKRRGRARPDSRSAGVLRDGERNVDGWHDCYVFDLRAGKVAGRARPDRRMV